MGIIHFFQFYPFLSCLEKASCKLFYWSEMIKKDGSRMSLQTLRPRAIINLTHVHILKLVLLRMRFLQEPA